MSDARFHLGFTYMHWFGRSFSMQNQQEEGFPIFMFEKRELETVEVAFEF